MGSYDSVFLSLCGKLRKTFNVRKKTNGWKTVVAYTCDRRRATGWRTAEARSYSAQAPPADRQTDKVTVYIQLFSFRTASVCLINSVVSCQQTIKRILLDCTKLLRFQKLSGKLPQLLKWINLLGFSWLFHGDIRSFTMAIHTVQFTKRRSKYTCHNSGRFARIYASLSNCSVIVDYILTHCYLSYQIYFQSLFVCSALLSRWY